MDHARLEEVEATAWADALSALPAATQATLGTSAELSAGCAVLRSAKLATPMLNRVIGLGARGPVADERVRSVLASFEAAGIKRYFVHRPPWADGLCSQLETAGLTRYHRNWAKFARGREAVAKAHTDLAVRAATHDDAEAFGRVFAEGFGLPTGAAAIFVALVGRPRWHAYVALEGEHLGGAALLFVDDDMGYLCGATTLPPFRKRGVQTALMARRLEHALDLGCNAISTETGVSVAGDPQHSYRNIERAGFRVAYLRENYVPKSMVSH
ncbi:MAG: GNAT family N-acetyltransferase [Polyangiales bacterium]